MSAPASSSERALPPQTFQRIATEMKGIGSANGVSNGVSRHEDAAAHRVDSWQSAHQSHTVETYTRNADGSISKTYVKDLPKGVREESTLRVGPNGSVKETTYSRNGQQTTIRITTLNDGTRIVTRDHGAEPAGASGPSQPVGAKADPRPAGNAPAPPSQEGAKVAPSAAPEQRPQSFQERFERDRQSYYDFFRQHPIGGERNRDWFTLTRQKLADEGNTFAIREIQREREREDAFRQSLLRDLQGPMLHPGCGPACA